MNRELENIKCVVCNSQQIDSFKEQPEDYEYGVKTEREFRVLQCCQCGSRFVFPRPTVEELVSFYPLIYHAYNEDHGLIAKRLVSMRAKRRAKELLKMTDSRPVRLFDVGTGDCRHFVDMSKYGDFEFAGNEIKPEMVDEARRRGYNVEQSSLEDLDIVPYRGKYDIVTMYQLVEHVIDPRVLLQKAMDLLKPGGYLLGQLPCMDSLDRKIFGRYWAGYHYPRHLQMLSKRGMRHLLEQAGSADVEINNAFHLQAGISLQNWIVSNMKRKPKMTYGKTAIYSFLLMGIAPFCIFESCIGQGGMMNFTARKPK